MGAVLFDIGSTLVEGPELSPVSMIARLLGLPNSQKHRVADIIMCRVFEDANRMSDFLMKTLAKDNYPQDEIIKLWHDQQKAPREIPGATLAVEYVKRKGFKVGLVSDIWAPYYKGFVDACPELAELVDYAGLSFREGIRKPSSRLLEIVINALEVHPRQCWMVGDTYFNDLAPAIEMGVQTVWVLNRPDKEYQAMEGVLKGTLPKPDIIVNSIAELCDIDLDIGAHK